MSGKVQPKVAENVEQAKKTETNSTCKFCVKEIEARCIICNEFLCYKCVARTNCSGSESNSLHDSVDLNDLMVVAERDIKAWKCGGIQELGEMKRELKEKEDAFEAAQKFFDTETNPVNKLILIEKLNARDVKMRKTKRTSSNFGSKKLEQVDRSGPEQKVSQKKDKLLKKGLKQQQSMTESKRPHSLDIPNTPVSDSQTTPLESPQVRPPSPVTPYPLEDVYENTELLSEQQVLNKRTSKTNEGAYQKGKARYDFNATEEKQVSLTSREQLIVLEQEVGNEWIKVQRVATGEIGVVPNSYVMLW